MVAQQTKSTISSRGSIHFIVLKWTNPGRPVLTFVVNCFGFGVEYISYQERGLLVANSTTEDTLLPWGHQRASRPSTGQSRAVQLLSITAPPIHWPSELPQDFKLFFLTDPSLIHLLGISDSPAAYPYRLRACSGLFLEQTSFRKDPTRRILLKMFPTT